MSNLRFEGLGKSNEMVVMRKGKLKGMWYTPQVYIDAVRAVMGDIDLDPATDDEIQKRIKARKYYTVHNDGLIHPWKGRVWIDPPYERKILLKFLRKALAEWRIGNISEMILITHTKETHADWFQDLGTASDAICVTRNGNIFFYFGKNIKKFNKSFKKFGFVNRKFIQGV